MTPLWAVYAVLAVLVVTGAVALDWHCDHREN